MGWFVRIFHRRKYSVSVNETNATFLYRERGRQIHVAGEAMADGYAVYSSSINAWEPHPGAATPPTIDDNERQRIASNIRSYFIERGKTVYLS